MVIGQHSRFPQVHHATQRGELTGNPAGHVTADHQREQQRRHADQQDDRQRELLGLQPDGVASFEYPGGS